MAISNSTARHITFGTDDQSDRALTPELKNSPQFVFLTHLNTPRGDYKRHHVTGNEFPTIFGAEGISPTSRFANFNTVFTNILAKNSSLVVQRLRGQVDLGGGTYRDANIAGIVFYVAVTDIAVGTVNTYARDATGKVVLDNTGARTFTANPTTSATKEYVVLSKWVPDVYGETVTVTGAVTTYPILGIQAEGHGTYYNDVGITITPNVGLETDTEMFDELRVLTYNMKVVDKSTGVPRLKTTKVGDPSLDFVFKPNTAVPTTGKGISLNFQFPEVYGNYIDPTKTLKSYTFDRKFKPYKVDALVTELNAMLQSEMVNTLGAQTWTDFNPTVDETVPAEVTAEAKVMEWAVNFLTGINTKGYEYESYRPMASATVATLTALGFKVVTISSNTITYLEGGEDGELTRTQFEDLVIADIAQYQDNDSVVQSIPLNKENILLDPGYTLATKLKLAPFISRRRNTMLGLSTYVFNEDNIVPSIVDELANANAIKSIVALNLESSEYNTPTMRAFIVMGSGLTKDGNYPYRVPLLTDYAVKMAKYTSALNGKRDTTKAFSKQSNSIITELVDIEPVYIPNSSKDYLKDAGIIWPDNNDVAEFFYPQHQTIYTDPTSVLDNVNTVQAITTLVTVNEQLWRLYSGTDDMSNLELKIAVENSFNEIIDGAFGNIYTIVPNVFFTERDINLGWIWRLSVSIYANNSKTQQISHVIALRASDLLN